MAPNQLDDITGRFGPGIAILYGTFTSLTNISTLYQRQKSIQEHRFEKSFVCNEKGR